MEIQGISSSVLSAQWVVCTMWKALGMGTALLAEKCLLWLLLETGSLRVDLFQQCQMYKRLTLPLPGREDSKAAEDDASKHVDDSNHEQGDDNDQDNLIEDHMSEQEEGGNDSERESEDDVDSYSDGGDDDDDDEWEEEEDEDSDMEDYYDGEEVSDEEDDEDESEDGASSSEESLDDDYYDFYPLLKHAKRVYPSDSFHLFLQEHRKTMTLDVDVTSEDFDARGLVIRYELKKQWDFYRRYIVNAVPMDGIVDCSCKYFVSSGIICCHAQVVLRCLHIDEIPERYILKTGSGNITTGSGSCFHKETEEKNQKSSPDCSGFRSAGSSSDIISGFEANEEITTDYLNPPLLRHARDAYSTDIFNIFKEEYKKSEYLIASRPYMFYEGCIKVAYRVEKPAVRSRLHIVCAVPDDGTVDCTCRKFSKTGILCSHAIVVLEYLCIVKIPAKYIVDKFKKDESVPNVQEIHGPDYPNQISFIRYTVLKNSFEKLVDIAVKSEEGERRVEQLLTEVMDRIKGEENNEAPNQSHLDSASASGKSTTFTALELKEEEAGLGVQSCNNLGEPGKVDEPITISGAPSCNMGKVDQSTVIEGAPSFSSPTTTFATLSETPDN